MKRAEVRSLETRIMEVLDGRLWVHPQNPYMLCGVTQASREIASLCRAYANRKPGRPRKSTSAD